LELRSCLRAALQAPHPTYLRIGKKGEPVVFGQEPPFVFGSWTCLRQGKGVTAILACGNTLPLAMEAAASLATQGKEPCVYSCASVKPLDEETLRKVFRERRAVLTIEEHALAAGFGSAVAEWVGDNRADGEARLIRLGAQDRYLHEAGEQEHARQAYGISVERMVSALARF